MQFSLHVMPAAKAKSGLPSFRIVSKREKSALGSFSTTCAECGFFYFILFYLFYRNFVYLNHARAYA